MFPHFALIDENGLYDGETRQLHEAERYFAQEADALAAAHPTWEIVPIIPMIGSR